jgi:hypothetical protein
MMGSSAVRPLDATKVADSVQDLGNDMARPRLKCPINLYLFDVVVNTNKP